VQAGVPSTFMGYPVIEAEDMPNVGAGNLPIAFGNFGIGYQIAQCMEMSIQRLNELYAATNQVGFIPRINIDGAPVLPAAFARVTLG
jgi:HK97 family phage major capsid protein